MGDSDKLIPVIDFSAYRLSLDQPDNKEDGAFQKLVQSVHRALTTIGFFYVINTDFPQDKVEHMWTMSKNFFHLPLDIKNQYSRYNNENHGYVRMERENLNPDRPYGDLKELFNYHPMTAKDRWPTSDECPGFKSTMIDFWDPCFVLHNRILEVMGYGLKLEDPLLFVKYHSKAIENSGTTLRTLHYPALVDVTAKENQVRCGEHSDYGGITLLFQEKPGLEVRGRDGNYIKGQHVEGGILVNIGDLMQRWTSDEYLAVKHRVLLATSPDEIAQPRQSIAFFGHPNYDALIECTDGSNKYPPINSLDYINMRFGVTY